MIHSPAFPPPVRRYIEAAVIGAGPAGLAAAVRLSQLSVKFEIFESGTSARERSRTCPRSIVEGVGGAGLYSDGKFSFAPSASALWSLTGESDRDAAFQFLVEMLRSEGMLATEGSNVSRRYRSQPSAHYKRYPSQRLSLESRVRIIGRMESQIENELHTRARVTALRASRDGFVLQVEGDSGPESVGARAIIFSGGRFGPLDFARIAPHCPMVFRRFEVGLRVEQPSVRFLYRDHPSFDVKRIESVAGTSEGWRTFCTCRDGEVVETEWQGIRSYSARADGEPTGSSSIGINWRTSSFPESPALLAEIYDTLRGRTAPRRFALSSYLLEDEALYGPELDRRFRDHLRALVPMVDHESCNVYGPCLEGVGFYPDITDSLKVNSQGIWVAGDSTGRFRGLTSAIVSGHYSATQVARYIAAAERPPAFVKQSPSDPMTVVFTAQSKQFFYCRDAICEYALRQEVLPVNPFRVFEYFLDDRVDRNLVRRGNNQLIATCDELWVFGPVSDGVLYEIVRARSLRKPVRFFTIGSRARDIKPIRVSEVKFEPELHASKKTREELLSLLSDALPVPDPLSDANKQGELFPPPGQQRNQPGADQEQ